MFLHVFCRLYYFSLGVYNDFLVFCWRGLVGVLARYQCLCAPRDFEVSNDSLWLGVWNDFSQIWPIWKMPVFPRYQCLCVSRGFSIPNHSLWLGGLNDFSANMGISSIPFLRKRAIQAHLGTFASKSLLFSRGKESLLLTHA